MDNTFRPPSRRPEGMTRTPPREALRLLLSTSHKFLFVHVPKTAGAATQRMLHSYCYTPERTLWRSFQRRLPIRQSPETAHFRTHETAARMRVKLGADVYNSLHSFAVCRNPFDHAISHFEYLKQYRSKRIARAFESVKFIDYLRMRSRPRMQWERIFVNLPDQSYFVVDAKGKIIVDRILSFENLHQDMRELQRGLGLREDPLPEFNITKARKKRNEKMVDYYGPDEIELVQQIYHRDFDVFDYSRDQNMAGQIKAQPAIK